VGTILLLVGLGLVTLYSASSAFSDRFFHDELYFLKRQVVYAALGLLLFLLASRVKLDFIRRFIGPIVLGVLFLCLLTFLPGIGVSKNGASRWIRIGSFTYQPSELVKVVLPIYLAHIFDKKGPDGQLFRRCPSSNPRYGGVFSNHLFSKQFFHRLVYHGKRLGNLFLSGA